MKKALPKQTIKLILSLLLITCSLKALSQVKSSIGIAGTLNYPAASNYKVGYGQAIQANIKISKNVALSPSIEHQKINVQFEDYYTGKQNTDLYFLRIAGKYYFTEKAYVDAGALYYIGVAGENVAGGFAPSASIGYEFRLSPKTNFDAAWFSNFIELKHKTLTAVFGIKASINFNLAN